MDILFLTLGILAALGGAQLFVAGGVSLVRLTSDVPIDVCNSILSSETRDEVSSLLSSVKGVGPKVLTNFFFLRDGS
jgi:hypothetical protein